MITPCWPSWGPRTCACPSSTPSPGPAGWPGGPATPLDLWHCGPLTFGDPDLDTFRCLALALEAARTGGTAGAILNGANEAAVGLFLEGKIGFLDIADKVALAMEQVAPVQDPALGDILEADRAAREAVLASR